jgi:putative PIN family toxin of toxin-antitoxin system
VRIVLDTNVLVSALLSPFGPPARILGLVMAGAIDCCVDARILAEYGDVLHRPRLSIAAAKADDVLDELRRSCLPVASVPLPRALPDPDDEQFVEVGLAGGARCLVTGNGVHFPDDRCLGLPILSPAELVEVVRRLSGLGSAAGSRHPD